eukprot:15466731-Alexandrium_andersonii.AAC.1
MASGADGPSSRAEHDGAASLPGHATGRTTQRDPAVRTLGAGEDGMPHCGTHPGNAGHAEPGKHPIRLADAEGF